MRPMSLFLLAAFLLTVQAHNLAPRTFGFFHSHPAQLQGHHAHSISAHAHGHSNHALPVHHGSHAGHVHQVHGHVHQGQVSHAHQHQVDHGPSAATHSAAAPIASQLNTVPVLMCRVVKVPANTKVPAAPPASKSDSSGTQHVGSHIATSISHVFGKVVNPVVALLQNASVWLNRTAHRDHIAAGLHPHQHISAMPHTSVIQKKLAAIKKLGPQRTSTASVTARPAVFPDATTAPSRGTSVPSTVAATTRSSPTTKMSPLPPVVVSTLGVPAPTLGVPVPRADSISTSTIAPTDMPASVPKEVSSRSNVTVQVADTTAAASEFTVTSTVAPTRSTLSTSAPTGTVHTTTATLGPLNLHADTFTISSTDLPASIPQDVSSTTPAAVDIPLLSQSTLPSTVAPTGTTARAALSTKAFTTSVDTTTPAPTGSQDPRPDPFTGLVTSTDVPTLGSVQRAQANTVAATSAGTKTPTPLFVESNARTVLTPSPKQQAASTAPAAVGTASVLVARLTAAPISVEITPAPPSAAAPTILSTEARPTVTTAEGITVATDSAVTPGAVALSSTLKPASSQPGNSTVIDTRSLRP